MQQPPCNSPATALQQPCSRPATALQQLCNSPAIALQQPCNSPAAVHHRPCLNQQIAFNSGSSCLNLLSQKHSWGRHVGTGRLLSTTPIRSKFCRICDVTDKTMRSKPCFCYSIVATRHIYRLSCKLVDALAKSSLSAAPATASQLWISRDGNFKQSPVTTTMLQECWSP